MSKKIPFLTYLFFCLVYANQGLMGLPGQSLYYLKRETWHLSATQLGWIAFAVTIPWTIKPIYGIITDCFGIKGYRTKYHLIISYVLLLLCIGYILFFGLNLVSMIVVGFLISLCTGFSDVANDTKMVILEQSEDLKGRLQCFDSKTDILTNHGWKNYKTINKTDKVLSLNPKTNEATYEKILNIYTAAYVGKMYRFKNSRFEFLFTPNHRITYNREPNSLYKVTTAEEMYTRQLIKHSNFISTITWNGKNRKSPMQFKLRNKHNHSYYILNIDFDLWLEFLGWYVSEGCLFEKRKDNQFSITQIKKRNEIRALLNKIKIPYWESKTEFLFCSESIYKHLKHYCYTPGKEKGSFRKKIPDYIKNLSKKQIEIFLQSFNKGDGWNRKGEIGYCTTSKYLYDELQELILKAGYGVSYKIIKRTQPNNNLYIVHQLFKRSCSFDESKNITPLHYNGVIWDIETNPHHNLFIRRKGRIICTGNSVQWSSLGIAGLFVALGGAYIASHFAEPFNYKLAYGLAAILPIITIFYLIKYYKENKETAKGSYKNIICNLKKAWNPNFLLGLAFIACLQFCPSFGTALMIKMREGLGVDKMFLGYSGTIGTVIGLVGYLLYYWKAYKFPLRKLLYFAVIFGAITNLFYLYLPNKWIIILYNVLFGAFGGISFLAIMSFMARIIPKGAEGLLYALATSVSNFFGGLSEPVGGYIYDKFGYNWNVIIASGFTLLCLIFIPKLKIE